MTDTWTQAGERYRFSTRNDLPKFAAMLADPEVGGWLFFAPLPEAELAGFFGPLLDAQTDALTAGETAENSVFTVESLAGDFLGQGGVIAVSGSPLGFEIGFQLSREAWGRGVGTRLGRFLCAYAITRCKAYRLEGSCLAGNKASAALLQKLGLKHEGTRAGYRQKASTRHDELFFGAEVASMDEPALQRLASELGL